MLTRTLSLKEARYPITSIIIKRSVIFNHISVINYYTFIVPKETTKLESLKENDKIKLIVLDENDNENIYEIIITDYPAILSTIIYILATIITAGIFLSPIVIILIIKKGNK